jgi:hypothetical protein
VSAVGTGGRRRPRQPPATRENVIFFTVRWKASWPQPKIGCNRATHGPQSATTSQADQHSFASENCTRAITACPLTIVTSAPFPVLIVVRELQRARKVGSRPSATILDCVADSCPILTPALKPHTSCTTSQRIERSVCDVSA